LGLHCPDYWLGHRSTLAAHSASGAAENPVVGDDSTQEADPSLTVALLTILAPVILGTLRIADFWLPTSSTLRLIADWFGNPIIAMLIGVLFLCVAARHHGFNSTKWLLSEEALPRCRGPPLVVPGGGFSEF
jgi:H+/gluconate symporter-like permease